MICFENMGLLPTRCFPALAGMFTYLVLHLTRLYQIGEFPKLEENIVANTIISCPSCSGDVQIEGRNNKDADRNAKYFLENGRVCDDCTYLERIVRAREYADSIELPALEGVSKKQIDYADVCRERHMRKLRQEYVNDGPLEIEKFDFFNSGPLQWERFNSRHKAIQLSSPVVDAGWWIELLDDSRKKTTITRIIEQLT